MSKGTILIFLSLISIVTLKNLKKGLFSKHGEACWLLKWCKGNLTCVDYRCIYKEEKAVHVKQQWSPNGLKCNFFHHCQSGYKCVDNYCKLKNSTESKEEFNAKMQQGIDDMKAGFSFMAERGIIPGANIYHAEVNSAIGRSIGTIDHEYVKKLYSFAAELYHKYDYKPFFNASVLRNSLANEFYEGWL